MEIKETRPTIPIRHRLRKDQVFVCKSGFSTLKPRNCSTWRMAGMSNPCQMCIRILSEIRNPVPASLARRFATALRRLGSGILTSSAVTCSGRCRNSSIVVLCRRQHVVLYTRSARSARQHLLHIRYSRPCTISFSNKPNYPAYYKQQSSSPGQWHIHNQASVCLDRWPS